eukprot:CAMPEP_0197179178 /NCGR_PEP_ID=MMETSP1423-20130617/4220_1 /TAXON_ID=476441 /ORGANISM="Pseudo-nitzschia heimii, Strain UNC1101" /LENGTH=1390 /DNA_ID=CAMNT_0042629059 /DNA_START=146 /DNA_END=4318 /DNA_ORIENTATION=+
MADRRHDAIESSRSSLSPGANRGFHRHVNSVATMDSTSWNKDSPKRTTSMTEKEINSLVHNALIRARQATKSFSPKSKAYQSQSPKSPPLSSKSQRPTVSTLSRTSPSSRGRPPVHSPTSSASPTKTRSSVNSLSSPSTKAISVPRLNHDSKAQNDRADFRSASEFRRPVSNPSSPKQAARELGSISSSDEFHTPVSAVIDAASQLSKQSSARTDDESLKIPASIDHSTWSVESTNSSDDIIKRVEEEIANARKAAREATRRLAGVSANFMSEVGREGSQSSNAIRKDNDVDIDTQLSQLSMLASGTGSVSSSTDEEGNFDSALNVIGEEFDDIVVNQKSEVSSKDGGVCTKNPDGEGNSEKREKLILPETTSESEVEHLRSCSDELDALELERLESSSKELDLFPVGALKAYNEKVTTTNDGNERPVVSTMTDEMKEANRKDIISATSSDDCLAYDEKMNDSQKDTNTETVGKESLNDDMPLGRQESQKIEEKTNFAAGNHNSTDLDTDAVDAITDKSDDVEMFIRTRSIEDCPLDEVPADESKALLTERSGKNKGDGSIVNGKIKTVVCTNTPIDELEAVLSDEREQDTFQVNTGVKSSECKSGSKDKIDVAKDTSEPNLQDQVTSIDQDEELDNDQLKMDMDVAESEPLSASREMDNDMKLNDLVISDDQEKKKEPASTSSGEKLDRQESTAVRRVTSKEEVKYMDGINQNSGEKTVISPQVSNIRSKDIADLETIPYVGEVVDGPVEYDHASDDKKNDGKETSVNSSPVDKCLDDAITETKCTESKDEETLAEMNSEINKTTMESSEHDDAVVDESVKLEETHDKNTEDLDETPSIENRVCGSSTIIDDESNFNDQITEIMDNRNHLTARLLNKVAIKEDGKALPNNLTTPLTPTSMKEVISKSEDIFDASNNNDDACHGKKVKFKQRYPIPQKMKKFRQPSEIIFDYQSEKPSEKLWYSKPKKDLNELLEAVTGASIQRRSNACGALKVLSTQKKNQLALVRTAGFMDSLVFAISENHYLKRDMKAGTAARTRAVNTVLKVAVRKDNRYHILLHPGLRESIVQCIIEDNAEARELACAVLATLAKSQHCRELMVKTEKLVDALAMVLKRDDNDHQTHVEEKVDYSGDDELSHEVSKTSSSSSSTLSISSSFEGFSVESQKEEDFEMRDRTRMNACAALLHLSKECTVSQELCGSDALMVSLISCCKEFQNPMHTKCLEILTNLSRFPHNNTRLVDYPDLVDALLMVGHQEGDFDRLWSMRIFQNLSSEPSAKAKLAKSSILELLSTNMMRKQYEEQLAATSTIYNISTEPGAVVPLTNTKNVVATLVHVSHNPTSSMELRTIACDTLATLGLWLQTLASSGNVPKGMKVVPLPSYVTSGWQRWDE